MPSPLLLGALLVFASGPGTAGAAWPLPPVGGQLGGGLTLTVAPGAPPVQWRIAVSTPAPDRRVAEIHASGAGTRLTLLLELDATSGNGRWTITEGVLEAAAWAPAVAAALGLEAEGFAAAGVIELGGTGEWRDNTPTGLVNVAWRDGRLQQQVEGWTLDGIAATGAFALDGGTGSVRSDGPFELTIGTITTARFGARALLVRGMLVSATTLVVREARIEIAGGDVALDPTEVPLAPLHLDLKLRLTRVGLQDLAALVPEALAEARGRVDGVVSLRWSEADGLRLGEGHLAVRHDEPAEVRLAPTPGLISASLPPDVLQYYPGLGQIETGEIPLRAELLEVTFTPEGDSEGRTAHVRLAGGPVDPKLRAPVDLTINVRGPLESLIKLGTSSRLQFGGTR